jgi:hypothetical protein
LGRCFGLDCLLWERSRVFISPSNCRDGPWAWHCLLRVYLSIGTAFDWPDQPATVRSWAVYPTLEDLKRKLESETPLWKRPFLFWLEHFGAWPISTAEPLSGIFDFNRAPYFQSFVEVRVERSVRRVRLILHRTIGKLSTCAAHFIYFTSLPLSYP